MEEQNTSAMQVGAIGRFESKRKSETENKKMIGDKQQYFKDKTNTTIFFPLVPVAIQKKLSRDEQKKLIEWYRKTIRECKLRGIKDMIAKIHAKRSKKRKIGKLGIS